MRSPTSRISRLLGLGVLAASLGLADGLGGAIAQGLELVGLLDQPAALVSRATMSLTRSAPPLPSERALDPLGVLADLPDIEHGPATTFGGRLLGLDPREASRPGRRRRGR